MQLSKNFTLKDLLYSKTAERFPKIKKLQQNPTKEIVKNLGALIKEVIQPLRNDLDFGIKSTSCYRCKALNKRVGGSRNSNHIRGLAMDCQVSNSFLTKKNEEFLNVIEFNFTRHTISSFIPLQIHAWDNHFCSITMNTFSALMSSTVLAIATDLAS